VKARRGARSQKAAVDGRRSGRNSDGESVDIQLGISAAKQIREAMGGVNRRIACAFLEYCTSAIGLPKHP
jgi:hypothetical protein